MRPARLPANRTARCRCGRRPRRIASQSPLDRRPVRSRSARPLTRRRSRSTDSTARGCSSMVELLLPKQMTRVRFPSPAPCSRRAAPLTKAEVRPRRGSPRPPARPRNPPPVAVHVGLDIAILKPQLSGGVAKVGLADVFERLRAPTAPRSRRSATRRAYRPLRRSRGSRRAACPARSVHGREDKDVLPGAASHLVGAMPAEQRVVIGSAEQPVVASPPNSESSPVLRSDGPRPSPPGSGPPRLVPRSESSRPTR